ncbi:tape measure protein [Pararoseomonas sp. SCSIO 73927]|uniref:tape measure protein n=1 Tax=Pararoseomonas sp. SCSIO 73927 TaxID=3114537 RepID=UPI0030D55780
MRLALILTAVNQLTRPLAQAHAQVQAFTRPIAAVNGMTRQLGSVAGVGRLSDALQGVGHQARYAMGMVGGLANRMTGLGAIAGTALGFASLAGFNAGFVRPAAEMERIRITLERVEGSSAGAQRALDWVSDFARRTPYELGEVTRAFLDIRNLGLDPTKGALERAGDAAAIMGTRYSEAVTALAAALRGEFDPLERFGVFAKVEGERAVIEWENNGRRMRSVVAKTNRALIAEAITRAWTQKFGGGMEALAQSWDGMMSNLSDTWGRFRLLVMQGGVFDFLKTQLGELLSWTERLSADGTLQRWSSTLGGQLLALGRGVRELVVGTAEVPPLMQRLSAVFEVVNGIVGPLVERYGGLELALGAIAAIVAGPVISALASMAVAVITLGVALLTTPVGWVIAGLAAIAGAVTLIYRNWGPISTWFSNLFRRIARDPQVQWLRSVLGPLFAGVAAFIQRAWSAMPGFFRNLWTFITSPFTAAAALIQRAWSVMPGFFRNLWTFITSPFTAAWGVIKPVLDALGVTDALQAAWEPLASFFEGLWERIEAAFRAAWDTVKPIMDKVVEAVRFLDRDANVGQPGPAQGQVNRRMAGRAQRIDGYDDEDMPDVPALPPRGLFLGDVMPDPQASPRDGVRLLPPGGARNPLLLPPSAPPPAARQREEVRVNAGGKLQIEIQDNRTNVTGRMDDPRIGLDVRRGLSMAD